MFKKLIFRIRIGLMHWEDTGNNREVFLLFIMMQFVLQVFMAISLLIESLLFFVLGFLFWVVLLEIQVTVGYFCKSMNTPISDASKRTKIQLYLWLINLVIVTILAFYHLPKLLL